MGSSKYRFTLDVHSVQSQTALPAIKQDTNRTLFISFSDGSQPFYIDTGCLAKLTIKRPTGTHIEEFCEIQNNTTVVYPFSQNEATCAVVGIHDCEVTLTDLDGQVLTSPRFSIIVHDRLVTVDIADEDKTTIDAMIAAEASRQAAEKGRVNAEAARESAEEKRESAEEKRVTDDEARQTAVEEAIAEIKTLLGKVVFLNLLASAWVGDSSPYSQVVKIDGATENSKVDLQPSVEQLAIFHEKDIAFVTENEDGVIRIYSIGDKPTNDYTIQATITEVIV